MASTILSLKEALHAPQRAFSALRSLSWAEQSVVRSTHFAETQIEWQGQSYMLYMPLTAHATRRIERFVTHKRHLTSQYVPKVTILQNEMIYEQAGLTLKCDIVIEELQATMPLKDAIATIANHAEAETLISSLDKLQQELVRADVSHNNIRVENIMLDSQNEAHLIRWYYATPSADNGQNDREGFSAVKEQIMEQTHAMELHDYTSTYNITPIDEVTYKDVRFLHEGLIAFMSDEGWGFMDSQHRVVITPQYLWVNDFREGRAEVETSDGMGLIDKEGTLIIPAKYQIVDYDPHSGNSEVQQNGEWALFNYQGAMIRDWGEHELEL